MAGAETHQAAHAAVVAERPRARAEMNITPLIDVLLIANIGGQN